MACLSRGWFVYAPWTPPFSFFGSRSTSSAAKTENPFPRSFFTPKPNENACDAGQTLRQNASRRIKSLADSGLHSISVQN